MTTRLATTSTWLASLRQASDERVSGTSLAVFRMVFGAVTAFVACRWIAYGWVNDLLVDPPIHFTYAGFHWVRPLPSFPMHVVVALIAVAGLCVAVGYRFRLAATYIAVGMAYVQLIDQTLYINHYYWMILTAGLLATSPAHRTWSLDARRSPRLGDGTVTRRWVWGMRAQVGMVYVFAGIAKIGTDWLLNAQPLSTWLPARADMPLIGPLLQHRETAYVMSWAGALFDLTIVAWLLWPRTRPYAFATVIVFHVLTWRLFPSIGAFPWPMIAGATMFYSPEWPLRWKSRLTHRTTIQAAERSPTPDLGDKPVLPGGWQRHLAITAAVMYITAMAVIPLRHIPVGSDIMWEGADYRFGWRVMLTERTGTVDFTLTDPETGTTWIEPPPPELTARQLEVMATDPALAKRAAAIVASHHQAVTGHNVDVHPVIHVAFNGRTSAVLVGPPHDADSASVIAGATGSG